MPITVRVYGDDKPGASRTAPASCLTLDAPRILIGRGESCEVRLPHPSVSARHVSIRQRGNDYVLVDEGSTNGTRVGKTTLSAQAPHTLKGRELVRVGLLWIELVVSSDPPTRSAPRRAKEIALDLVARALEREGEEGRPIVRVASGESEGTEARVPPGEALVIGRARDAHLFVDDPEASRRHVEIRQRGDVLVVRDLGSKAGSAIGDRPLDGTDTVWKTTETLRIAGTELSYRFEAAEALAELERQPDLKVPLRAFEEQRPLVEEPEPDFEDPLEGEVGDEAGAAENADSDGGSPTPEHEVAILPTTAEARRRGAIWSVTDFAVVLLALGVFSLSAVGYWVLLR